MVRSIELILGMEPLNLNDALAAPMYDVFSPTAVDTTPVTALPAGVDLLSRNGSAAPDSMWSSSLALGQPDQVPQWQLDQILWHSVFGADSQPPPPGPGAEGESREGHDAD